MHSMLRRDWWEVLAEVHFISNKPMCDKNYIYCLCSRAIARTRDEMYFAEEELSESEDEEIEHHSHVHFSTETPDNFKEEKDDITSCYCSASHTDNNYSTDEHDACSSTPRALQASDSGADLTFHETNSECTSLTTDCCKFTSAKIDQIIDNNSSNQCMSMDQDPLISENIKNTKSKENYFSQESWEKYWSVNGERLIWASWIEKYSDYINPSYLESNEVSKENKPLKQSASFDREIDGKTFKTSSSNFLIEPLRERKFSYDSKVNPYKEAVKQQNFSNKTSNEHINGNDDSWTAVPRKRACSEHERVLSPRTLTTDSLTNVTNMSNYDMYSSHVTSESSTSEDRSLSSPSSADNSNENGKSVMTDDFSDVAINSIETEQEKYWQLLWRKHFADQYALHYANFLQLHTINSSICPDSPMVNDENMEDVEFDNSEGHSQEFPSVVEVKKPVASIKKDGNKSLKRSKNRKSQRAVQSVGLLLQTLFLENNRSTDSEVLGAEMDNSDDNTSKESGKSGDADKPSKQTVVNTITSSIKNPQPLRSSSQDDEDPPEKKSVSLKRSHEIDYEEHDENEGDDRIQSTLQQMGVVWGGVAPCGSLVYRKKATRLRPLRRTKVRPNKVYFDDEGNACTILDKVNNFLETADDMEGIQTTMEGDSELLIKSTLSNTKQEDTDTSVSDILESEEPKTEMDQETTLKGESFEISGCETIKRKKRKKKSTFQLPVELCGDKSMMKYWRRRHSLFSKFDSGIKLDLESWFSVTPEKVALHIADRCRCDLLVDAFCGAGGNAIQFAFTCERVIAIDIDPVKIEIARHNAAVYGVEDRIEFIVGDFFQLAETLVADVVFLSPPWGGPQYTQEASYDLENMLQPEPASKLMSFAKKISENVAMFIPRTSKACQIVQMAGEGGSVEIEQSFLDKRLIAITAYYGELVK